MKFCLFALLMSAFTVSGQTFERKAVSVVSQRSIYLNGGVNASFGGKSRTTIPITLPENTVSWYYSFSTTPGQSGAQNLNLLAQLAALAIDPTGLTSDIVSLIKIPSGSAIIEAYLMDQENSDAFLRKVDLNGGTYSFYREGTLTNTKHAVVPINNFPQGTHYLGLKNPSEIDGVNIYLEVVAIVLEESEQESEAVAMGNLGWKAFERGDYNKCIELSKKALEIDNTLGVFQFNIALSYLILGQTKIALDEYVKAIGITKKQMSLRIHSKVQLRI